MIVKKTDNLKNQQLNNSSKVRNFTKEEKEKLKKAVFDFQALLINQMLQSMRETKFSDEEDSLGYGNETFTELFDMQFSSAISVNSRFGIAELLYEKLTGEKLIDDNSKISINNDLKNKKSINNDNKIQNLDTKNKNINISNKKISSKYSFNVFDILEKYDEIIKTSAETFDVDPNLIKAIIAAESSGNPNAISKAKAKGLMQLMDATARSMGVKNVFNPVDNINGGTKYFKYLLDKYNGDIKLALAAYNAGPGAVDKYDGIPPFKETKNYVNRVLNYYSLLKADRQELALNE